MPIPEQNHNTTIPVVILSGFLGTGKTTLLKQWIQWSMEQGLKPAVVMNEAGEVNLDGQLLPADVAMKEMLNGCICCSMRGDFGLKLYELVQEEQPDIIYVECTGIAEPMELVDSITEISLYTNVVLTTIVTLADAKHLADLFLPDSGAASGKSSRKMLHLLQEQVRAAQLILLNKADLATADQLEAVKLRLREWNAGARIEVTRHAKVEPELWRSCIEAGGSLSAAEKPNPIAAEDHNHHHAHDTVTVWTYTMPRAVDSERFEQWLMSLPLNVYRAKGIVTFTDTTKRYMFQFAYRATEFVPITPQGDVKDVIVVIGEQMDTAAFEQSLLACE
ncbi:CobW family GTP-binding protein [Paenibacillus apiarius]|uniref:GTP-binding protein n=1 Tax=Paenibacillus apiarius TaxID=46240 RepID=A0ABT4DTV8_9BACL|nr:GTP-binding protein [Paenibacillus apiarius]MCY9515868.1 GTP-binding protein [Paenibacillus apiarius]MCY9520778.1 GTP-binding protein [Paenibacillus apiarius]MCY9553482.1 GTP-binding protein [Paenibacillus apiarius]MCY9557994.1 GTP-binding protein [Paenibacillus apiarius]MCY9685849.1 GTP-binding protein [Paenibacillus apiarius]